MSSAQKIKPRDELALICDRLRTEGKKIVFANGCFDLLHVGHIRYFEDAKSKADVLIVGVNSDRSVRELKGPPRPVMPEGERAEIVAALEAVDYVCWFDERTADETIRRLRPHYHAKGPEYAGKDPEDTALKEVGGEFLICGDPKAHSVTDTLKEIAKRFRTG